MGVLKKIGYHVFLNGIGTQSQGAKIARNAAKGIGIDNPFAEWGAIAVGAFAGSILGGIKMISPLSILETASQSEAELEERAEKMDSWGGLE